MLGDESLPAPIFVGATPKESFRRDPPDKHFRTRKKFKVRIGSSFYLYDMFLIFV